MMVNILGVMFSDRGKLTYILRSNLRTLKIDSPCEIMADDNAVENCVLR